MIALSDVVLNGQKLTSTQQVDELEDFMNESSNERLIRTANGTAEIYLTDDAVCVTSQGSNGMIVNKYGTTLDGKIHLAPDPNNVRISGFWTLNNELLTCIPSTLYTPIPTLVYDEPPAVGVIQSLAKYYSSL